MKALLLVKKDKIKYTQEIAVRIGVTGGIVYNWFSLYKQDRFLKLCEVNKGGNNTFLKVFGSRTTRKSIIFVIDNAGFHAAKNIQIPENIKLLRIPHMCS